MNTMEDLRREVATRLRDTLHGREIDLMEEEPLQLEHMLGATPIGESRSLEDEDDTILRPDHEFWDEWHSDAMSGHYTRDKIKTAIHSLKQDGILRMTHPYGEEADILYIEVDEMPSDELVLQTSCSECGTDISTAPSLDESSGHYNLRFSIECPECEFTGMYESRLQRL